MKNRSAILAICLLLLSSSLAFGQNLLQNPSFEDWTGGEYPDFWMLSFNSIQQSSDPVRDGSYSLGINPGGDNVLYQSINAIPNQEYMFNLKVMDNLPNTQIYVALVFFDTNGQQIGDEVQGRYSWDGEGWQTLAAVAVAPENASVVQAVMRVTMGTDLFYVDSAWLGFKMDVNEARQQTVGDPVVVRGVITVPSGKLYSTTANLYVQDNTAGIRIFDYYDQFGSELQVGDEVLIGGDLIYPSSGGLVNIAEIANSTYLVLSSGNNLPEPIIYGTGDFAENGMDDEGSLGKLTGTITIEEVSGHTRMYINDGSGETQIFIYSYTGLDLTDFSDGDNIAAVGVIGSYYETNQLWVTEQTNIWHIDNTIDPPEDFCVDVHGSIGSMNDSPLRIKFDENATDGYDPGLDIPKPVMPSSDFLDVYVPVSGDSWDQVGITRLLQDTKSSLEMDQVTRNTTFSVNSDHVGEIVTLQFGVGTLIPDAYVVFLSVNGTDELINLRDEPIYSFEATADERQFTLFVGTPGGPEVTILAPEENTALEIGEEIEVSWQVNDIYPIETLTLKYFNGEENFQVADLTSASSPYTWTVPNDPFTDQYLILEAINSMEIAGSDSVIITIQDSQGPVVEGFTYPEGLTVIAGGPVLLSWDAITDISTISSVDLYQSIDEAEYELLQDLSLEQTEFNYILPFSSGTMIQLKLVVEDEYGNATEMETPLYDVVNPNILMNGGFEEWNDSGDDPLYWFKSSDDLTLQQAEGGDFEPYEGNSYNRLEMSIVDEQYLYQTVTGIIPGETYGLRAFVNENDESLVAVVKCQFYSLGEALGEVILGDASQDLDDWQELTLNVIAPENADELKFSIHLDNTVLSNSICGLDAVALLSNDFYAPEVDFTSAPVEGDEVSVGETQTIEWTATDNETVDYSLLYVSYDEGDFTRLMPDTLHYPTETYDWVIPNQPSDNVRLIVESYDEAGNVGTDTTDIFSIIVSKQFDGHWHLMSQPLVNDNSTVETLVGDDVENVFYMYDYNGNGYDLMESTGEVTTGRGYWLYLESGEELVDANGTGLDSVTIDLQQGWNIIGGLNKGALINGDVTFSNDNTSWISYNESIQEEYGWLMAGIYGYTDGEGYANASAVNPWGGYWVYANQSNITMKIVPSGDYDGYDAEGEPEVELDELIWFAGLNISQDDLSENIVFIGTDEEATNGYDSYFDYAMPPSSPDDFVSLRVKHTDWETPVEDFARDIREPITGGQSATWNLEVTASQEGEVEVEFRGLVEALSEEYVAVVNYDGNEYSLSEESSLTFDYVDEALAMDLTITNTSSGINTGFDTVPVDYAIAATYPNPFNPTLTAVISLPQSSNLTVQVFNIMGQRIATLAEGHFQEGYHSFVFDGTGMASGVYFINASVPGKLNQMKKVVLMK